MKDLPIGKKVKGKKNRNPWEQNSWWNNLEITGVSDNVEDEKLDEKGNGILQKIKVNIATQDIELCHWFRISKNNSKINYYSFH